ncbi:uncharacterized protein LOC133778578 [Humulus lupulus]|uniref:uncharacterized protein LOC133778578 n=1 Tax=Humulus lupulus TaxID=3486 RepID=UPI002B40F26F|nr:uncharacterized protein LOC133778578 [Humulus lupulus]
MASMHCYKPASENCQEKCLDNCYGHSKPNSTGSYYSGHSMAGLGQTHNASLGQSCYPDHTVAKPNMNSTYGQGYGHHMMTGQYGQPMAKPAPGQSYGMGPAPSHGMGMMSHAHSSMSHAAHGQNHHGYAEHQSYGSHGMMGVGGCHEKKADHYGKKKDRSHRMMNKRRDCNRSGDSSGSDSDSDCN